MLRALTHASHFLIYLKCTVVWKMYTAVSLSVKRLIASSNACIFHKERRQQTFLYSCPEAVSQRQHIYLLKERDRSFFRIFKNLNSYYFRGCTVHLDSIKIFFIFSNGCTIYLLRSTLKFTLKFTLKLLLHVSV